MPQAGSNYFLKLTKQNQTGGKYPEGALPEM